jgi:hypothetical protein
VVPSDINTTDVDFLFADTDLQALFDNDFELQNVPPCKCSECSVYASTIQQPHGG